MPAGADRRAVALLVLLAAATWANAFAGAFQFDDHLVIVRERSVQSLAAWWDALPSIRPLLKLSYTLNHASGAGILGFHVVNLLIHALNTVLVYVLARRLAAAGPAAGDVHVVALVTAALFALHPVQTEAVTYVSGRSTSLAALFALVAVLLWLQRDAVRWAAAASAVAFVAGVACKEYVAVTPLALLLLAWMQDRRPGWLRRALPALLPHGLLLVMVALAAAQVPRYAELFAFSMALRGVGDNLAAQVHAVTWLAGQLIRLDRLNADPALPVQALDTAGLALLALWAAGGGLAFALRQRQPALLFAWLWFLLWLLPTQSALPRADLANERALYLPLIGPAFVLGTWLATLTPQRRWLLVAPALVGLGVVTHSRNQLYADEVRFWADVSIKAPHNSRAFTNLGVALMDACRLDEAAAALATARSLAPDDIKPAANAQLLPGRRAQCDAGGGLPVGRGGPRASVPAPDAAAPYVSAAGLGHQAATSLAPAVRSRALPT